MPNPKSYHPVKDAYNALVRLIHDNSACFYGAIDPKDMITGQLTRMAQMLDSSLSKLSTTERNRLSIIVSQQADTLLSMFEKDMHRPLIDMEPTFSARSAHLAKKLTTREEKSTIEQFLFSDKMPHFFKMFCHEVAKFCRNVLGKPTIADEIERGAAAIVKEHKKLMRDAKLAGKKVATAKPQLSSTGDLHSRGSAYIR
jgi:hypothetical protein